MRDLRHTRPYWFVDAKWVFGLLLLVAVAVTLPVVSVYRLTEKKPATKLVSYMMAGLTSPAGIDSADGLGNLQQEVAQQGSKSVTLAGITVTFTEHDVQTLSPRELRLKVFGAFAAQFYDKGAIGLAKSQGLDQAAAEQFQNQSSLLSLFTANTHNKIGTYVRLLIALDLLLAAITIFFSSRFGRLASVGLILLIAGLPGIILSVIASHHPDVAGTARMDNATSTASMFGTFMSFMAPLVLPILASTYLFVFKMGAALLSAAGVGRIAYAVIRHMRPHDEPGSPREGLADQARETTQKEDRTEKNPGKTPEK